MYNCDITTYVVRLRLNELLRGRSLYWLAEESGIKYPGLRKISKGQTNGIQFDTLDALCRALNCKLTELIVRDEDDETTGKDT
jgi:putative transcriptional regulator